MQAITSMAPALCQHPPYWYPWCFYSTVVLWVVGVDGGELGLNDDKGRGEEFPARLAGDREQRRFVKWVIWYVRPQRCDWIFSGARVYWRCKPKLLDTINRTRSSRRREVNSRLADTEQIDSGKQARGETETAKFS